MGAGSGGRLALSLIAVVAVMASGVAGTTMFGSGGGHSRGGSSGQDRMLGSNLQRQSGPGGTMSASAPRSSRRPAGGRTRAPDRRAQAGGSAAGRFNVGFTHSPELLQQLDGPLSKTGHPAARYAGLAGTASETASVAAAMPEGVDVASFQHPKSTQYPNGAPIDWSQVAGAGYTFAAIKATEGSYYTNPFYASDVAAAKAACLYVAGYHFAIPNASDGAAAQADYAVTNGQYAADGQTLPLELDVEYDPYTSTDHTNQCYGLTPAQMVAWISAFDTEAQRVTGLAPDHLYRGRLVEHLHGEQHRLRRGSAVGGRVRDVRPSAASRLAGLVLLAVLEQRHGPRHHDVRRHRRELLQRQPGPPAEHRR